MLKAIVGLLCSTCLLAQNYTNVFLAVSAPKAWQETVKDELTVKLNAIPDVQVTDVEADAAFTISVDINSITNRSDETLGYSMMALIYGTYDRKVLQALFENEGVQTTDKQAKAGVALLKYIISGNIFLAATVHTHGSLDNISSAYDEIVGKLKTKALPELRRFSKMLSDLESGNKALPAKRF